MDTPFASSMLKTKNTYNICSTVRYVLTLLHLSFFLPFRIPPFVFAIKNSQLLISSILAMFVSYTRAYSNTFYLRSQTI